MAEAIIELVIRILLLPVTLVVVTPIILILSLFGDGQYTEKLKKCYKKIIDFYLSWI